MVKQKHSPTRATTDDHPQRCRQFSHAPIVTVAAASCGDCRDSGEPVSTVVHLPILLPSTERSTRGGSGCKTNWREQLLQPTVLKSTNPGSIARDT